MHSLRLGLLAKLEFSKKSQVYLHINIHCYYDYTGVYLVEEG